MNSPKRGPGSLHAELIRTAEMMVQLASDAGVYYAIALLYDSGYGNERMRALLPLLEKEHGAIKPTKRGDE